MESIRIRNLRCLADTGTIEIKPITLLVGANSSGKSSFLRVFPLLRQSAEMRTLSGLLLNEGDVNFGFFDDAVHRDADPSELKLEFNFTLTPGLFQGRFVNRFLIEAMPVTIELTYTKRNKDQRYPYLRGVRFTLKNEHTTDIIEICAEEEGKIGKFKVNEYQANGEMAQLRLLVGRGLVPALVRVLDDKDDSDSLISEDVSGILPFEQKLLTETDSLFHKLTAKETRLDMLRTIRIGAAPQMLSAMKVITGATTWTQRLHGWTLQTPKFHKVRALLLAKATSALLSSANLYVTELARSVYYYKPVRAGVERDYLSRDVQVSSVDASGLNVAMVLSSWEQSALRKFREWTRTNFGFEIYPQSVSDGARIALRMKEGSSGAEFNLADMGFGFSQMLPFIVQIWNLVEYEPTRARSRFALHNRLNSSAVRRSYLIAIEQPELHLHPALQARLADLFVNITRVSAERNLPLRFVLETHSPTIIEQIGYLVEAQRIKADDVQVLLFQREGDGQQANSATVRRSYFDAKGILQDWPFGFLAPPPNPPAAVRVASDSPASNS